MRCVPQAVVAAFILCVSLLAPSGLAVPEHDDSIYTWHVEDGSESASGNHCTLISPSLEATDSPCEALGYSMGNTDTHMFFRWTLATLAFSDLADAIAGFSDDGHPTVEYRQSFRGTAEDNDRFGFVIALQPDGQPFVSDASDLAEAWAEQGQIEVESDPAEGTITASVPLETIAPTLENGLIVGESFNFSSTPSIRATASPMAFDSGALNTWQNADDVPAAVDGTNRTYTIQWYGDFVPAPTEVTGVLNGTAPYVEIEAEEPVWETHTYSWAVNASSISASRSIGIEDGSAAVRLTDSLEEVHLDELVTGSDDATDPIESEPSLDWTLELRLERFVGKLRVDLEAAALEDGEEGEGGGHEENPGEGNTTGGPTDVEDQEEGAPAPHVILLIAVVLAGVVALRARNQERTR